MTAVRIEIAGGPAWGACARQMTLICGWDEIHVPLEEEALIEGILRERRIGRKLLKEERRARDFADGVKT